MGVCGWARALGAFFLLFCFDENNRLDLIWRVSLGEMLAWWHVSPPTYHANNGLSGELSPRKRALV